MAVPCTYNTPRQTTAVFNVIYVHFTIHSGHSVEVKCRKAEECLGHTMIWAVSWLCRQVCDLLWASMHTMLHSMHRLCSWLLSVRVYFFNGVVSFESISRADGRLCGTLTRAQHWTRHIFLPPPLTIHWNKPSYEVRWIHCNYKIAHASTHGADMCPEGSEALRWQDDGPLAQ